LREGLKINTTPTTRNYLRALIPFALVTIVLMGALASPARAVLGSVSAQWPSSKIRLNTSASVTGHVSGIELGDGVFLQQKVLGGWRTITKTRLDSNRDYKLSVPTWWLGTRTYRVITGSLLDTTLLGTPSTSWTVQVVPTYDAPGIATQHSYSTSSYARWNPCQTIGYRVNTRLATSGALADVKGAFARLSQATGFRFAYRGTTTGIPTLGSNSWYPADTQIVVAWARRSQSTMLQSYSNAVAVGAAITSGGYAESDGTSVSKIIKGAVVVDSARIYRGGFGTGKTRGDVLLHELGHTMGLGHTGGSRQIMYPSLTSGLARLGEGDLTGLVKHGARLGCVDSALLYLRGSTAPQMHLNR
jgi:Matrixin